MHPNAPRSDTQLFGRAAVLYLVAIVAATWPYVLTIRSRLPSLVDPLQHLWVMRWYRTCLIEGRSPLVCDEIQYPLGAPIGNFSPLHLQGLLFVGLRAFLDNDLLVYNLIWLAGFLMTGLGTYALARRFVRNEPAALLAGLLAMLSGPMMVHSHCHLELIHVGAVPLFVLAWMRFVDGPSVGRLLAALGALTLVAMSAAYYLVFASLIGGLYAGYRAVELARLRDRSRLVRMVPWLFAFSCVCLVPLAMLFAPQIWSTVQGRTMARSRADFDGFHLPWWTYMTPSPGHRIAAFLPFDPYAAAKVSGEGTGYLGVVCISLVALAWRRGIAIERARFWWLALAVSFVVSLGSYLPYDGHRIDLPAACLWDWYPPFHLIRVPARMKFFAAIFAAVIAGAAYARLDARLASRRLRRLAFGAVATIAVIDLAHDQYATAVIPNVPPGYAWLLDFDPDAVWVDLPQSWSGGAEPANALCMYWQSHHRGCTTAGYSGQGQWSLDGLLSWSSPFSQDRLVDPFYLASESTERFDLVTDTDPAGYVWTYLHAHQLPYVVLHRWTAGDHPSLEAIRRLLAPALIYEDDLLAIYERDRLPRPTKSVVLCLDGWDTRAAPPVDGLVRPVGERAGLIVYNPDASTRLVLGLRARALGRARRVRLVGERGPIADWTLPRKTQTLFSSPPFTLPLGLSRLEITAEGAVPRGEDGHRLDNVANPISLLVSGVNLRTFEPAITDATSRDGEVIR